MTTTVQNATELKPAERTAPDQAFKGVRMSVKSGSRIDFKVDLGRLVNLQMTEEDFRAASKNSTDRAKDNGYIAEIPLQRLRVQGVEDVYVELRVYTKRDKYEARKILKQKEVEAKQKADALEAIRPQVEAVAAALGCTFEEALAKLTK